MYLKGGSTYSSYSEPQPNPFLQNAMVNPALAVPTTAPTPEENSSEKVDKDEMTISTVDQRYNLMQKLLRGSQDEVIH